MEVKTMLPYEASEKIARKVKMMINDPSVTQDISSLLRGEVDHVDLFDYYFELASETGNTKLFDKLVTQYYTRSVMITYDSTNKRLKRIVRKGTATDSSNTEVDEVTNGK